jgi:hypothetical protein
MVRVVEEFYNAVEAQLRPSKLAETGMERIFGRRWEWRRGG